MELKLKAEISLGRFWFFFFFNRVKILYVTYSFQQDPNDFPSQKQTEKVII